MAAASAGEDELALLRRRAYGRGDVAPLDHAGRERLAELERLRAGGARKTPATAEPAPAGPAAAGPAPAGPALVAATDGSELPHASSPQAPDAARGAPPTAAPGLGGVLRDWRTWLLVAVAGLAGGAIVFGVMAAQAARPDITLERDPSPSTSLLSEGFDWISELGIDRGSDSVHAFHGIGRFTPWIAERNGGGACLLIVEGGQSIVATSCVGRGLDPVVDLDLSQWFDGDDDLPSSGTARFEVSGDTIEVWLSEPDVEVS